MKKEMTYHHLHTIETDLENLKKNHPALCLLLHGTIKRFFESNKVQFDAMYKGMYELRKKFIETDSMGNLLTELNKDGQPQWQYKTYYTDLASATHCMGKTAVAQKLNEKLTEFMQLTVSVII